MTERMGDHPAIAEGAVVLWPRALVCSGDDDDWQEGNGGVDNKNRLFHARSDNGLQ